MSLTWNPINETETIYTIQYRLSLSYQDLVSEESLLQSGISAFSSWPASYVAFAAQAAINVVQTWTVWDFPIVQMNGMYQVQDIQFNVVSEISFKL